MRGSFTNWSPDPSWAPIIEVANARFDSDGPAPRPRYDAIVRLPAEARAKVERTRAEREDTGAIAQRLYERESEARVQWLGAQQALKTFENAARWADVKNEQDATRLDNQHKMLKSAIERAKGELDAIVDRRQRARVPKLYDAVENWLRRLPGAKLRSVPASNNPSLGLPTGDVELLKPTQ